MSDSEGEKKHFRFGRMAALAAAALLAGAWTGGCSGGRLEIRSGWEKSLPASGENRGEKSGEPASGENRGGKAGEPASGENRGGKAGEPDSGENRGEKTEKMPSEGSEKAVKGGNAGEEQSRPEQDEKPEKKKNNSSEDEMLPERYDAREMGRAAPVEDQGELGTCWAFASLQSLENSLLPDEIFDFSEDHMSKNPNFNLGQESGGDYIMSMAYLLSWQGPVLETEDPYGDGISPRGLKPAKHVQEIRLLPPGDRQAIKQAVYESGGVQSALYTSLQGRDSLSGYYNRETGAYCCLEEKTANHDIVIIGWDDHYPAENFTSEVPGDGAFLCENSWGTGFGLDGFFYVSYYDANLGKTAIQYKKTENADNYDKIYQSDLCGWVGQAGYGAETAWAVNVYTAGSEEALEAAGFYATDKNSDYEIYLVRDVPEEPELLKDSCFQQREKYASGHLEYAGYYTIPLKKPETLKPGERFGIMIKITTPGAVHPVAVEYDAGDDKCRIDLTDGEGYLSPDGKQWERAEETQACNLCLKAYTS